MKQQRIQLYLKVLAVLGMLWTQRSVMAQQEQQYSGWMFHHSLWNPAAAGNKESMILGVGNRSQWLGLQGAPNTQWIQFHSGAFNQRVGLGVNITRNSIGIFERYTLDLQYNYRLKLGDGLLSVGLQGSVRQFRANYNDPSVKATQPKQLDISIPGAESSILFPNFGAGMYYKARNWNVGFSVPRLVNSKLDFTGADLQSSREVVHLYLHGGGQLRLNDAVKFETQGMLRWAERSPVSSDVYAGLIMLERFTVGANTRMYYYPGVAVESVGMIVGVEVGEKLSLGLGYDIGLNQLRDYHNGSFELWVRYRFNGSDDPEVINPRFF